MPNVFKSGEGSALMADQPRAAAIIRGCKKSGKIITVKCRTGIQRENMYAAEFARMCEDADLMMERTGADGVSHIGSYAFHRCHALKSISIPVSVKELGDCVFLYCDSLTDVHIPGVERLGKQVFVNDVLLRKLEISPGLQKECICDVFTGCIGITDFSFPDGRKIMIPTRWRRWREIWIFLLWSARSLWIFCGCGRERLLGTA